MTLRTYLGVLVVYFVVLLSEICTAEPLHCGGRDCDAHHDSCQLQHNSHFHCADRKHCHGVCHENMSPEERQVCCCHTQHCIDTFLSHVLPVNPFANLGAGITCGPDICSTAEEPFCVIHHGGFECDHHCDEHHMCEPTPPMHNGNVADCCCKDQACVDFITSNYHVEMAGVKCPDCPNVQHNECHGDLHHRCPPHELCKVKTNDMGILSTNCQRNDDCLREQLAGVFGPDANDQFCCATQTCILNAKRQALGITTTATTVVPTPAQTNAQMASTQPLPTATPLPTTTAKPLHCPVCTDAFTGDCPRNALCASDEGCLLVVTAGKLQTGCKEISDCKYHERIGDSVCCTDKNCTDNAFKQMNDMAFTCPTCEHTQDPQSCMNTQGKCSYLSKGCMITHSQSGLSSGCNTHKTHCQRAEDLNSVLCNVHPIPFAYSPGLQCSFCCHKNDSTCVLDALGIHDVTPPPTSDPAAGTSALCADHEDASFSCKTYDTQFGLCSSSSPLMVQLVNTKCRKTCGQCPAAVTVAITTGSPIQCVDKVGTCSGMASFLCTSTDPSSQTYANENCAKTCNLCVTIPTTTVIPCVDVDSTCAGMASFLCSSTDPVSQAYAKSHCAKTCNQCTTAQSPTTTLVPVQCVDHDLNNNCVTMANALCTSQEPHVKNFAIATCAKTCNLCTEYNQHLAGLTLPLLG
ncbi:hypothetical protein KP79_PYT03692 [Mizuhopecten yessoensis]|uniref:ShKT domain-containing protein n=2 Tax=Mizuhopecten yessoensis TaxID=6573 RepID=A0A210PSM3_MIZYE|nr:hypothetical protein KP79_PYT03692 [Mizuhopecten yessoensis]